MKTTHLLSHLLIACCLIAAGCGRVAPSGPPPDPKLALEIRERLQSGAASSTAAPAEAPKLSTTEWGTLKGRFVYAGGPVTPARLRIDKDVEVCTEHPPVDESVVVGDGGGLANVVVYVRTKNVPVHVDYQSTASAEVKLDNLHCRFEPHVLALRDTQKLLLVNSDSVGHNSKIDLVSNEPLNVLLQPKQSNQPAIKQAEAAPIKVGCNIHPWMGGWLVVRPDPYFAVSAADGSFEIKNLPCGEIEFQVWQEKIQNIEQANVGGAKAQWPKGRMKHTIKPGENDLGDIEVAF